MKEEQKQKYIEKLSSNIYGKVLREILEEEKKELLNVLNATSWEDALGRQHAAKVIDRLLARISEKSTPEERVFNEYN